MIRCSLLFLLFLMLPAGIALADVGDVSYTSSLMEGEDLLVMVEGWLPDGCWEFLGSSTNATEQMLIVTIDTNKLVLPAGCPTMVTPYWVEAVFPALTEGNYTLRIYETHSPLDPIILDFPVEVASPVGNDETTWEFIKALYR